MFHAQKSVDSQFLNSEIPCQLNMEPVEDSNEMDKECLICLLPLDSIPHENKDCPTCEITVCSVASIPSCGHECFHYCCLERWREIERETGRAVINHTCPFCRGSYTSPNRFLNLGTTRMMVSAPPNRSTFQRDRALFIFFMGNNIERTKIYSYRLLSHPIGGEFHEFTPQEFAISDAMHRRVHDFIGREFQIAFQPLSPEDATEEEKFCKFFAESIIELLSSYDLRENFHELTGAVSYLFRKRYRAETFLHELKAWLESDYDTLDLWDQNTEYSAPTLIPLRPRPAMPQRGVPFTPRIPRLLSPMI